MNAQAAAPGPSMVYAAYEQIRRRILDNVWPPGHRALEQEVALELGMSRTPVREALLQLQNEGLVEVIPRHGVRVLPVSPTDMREIYEILTALECMAAELLARRKPGAASCSFACVSPNTTRCRVFPVSVFLVDCRGPHGLQADGRQCAF